MKVLETRDITVAIQGAKLIKNISTTIDSGEILAVVGPNGSGKTTLLNTITGDVGLSSGDISICGHPLSWTMRERAKSIAVLPQLSLLNFPYSVEEVVALGRTPHSTGISLDRKIVHEAMEVMDISHLSGRSYTQLSGGEKQRTQLARVMAQIWRKEDASSRLLLLDEPTTALDLGHQQQLMNAVVEFAKNGAGVLMVVHDINIAARYADKILALSCGRCIAQGSTKDVLSENLLQQLFGAEVGIIQDPSSQKMFVIS